MLNVSNEKTQLELREKENLRKNGMFAKIGVRDNSKRPSHSRAAGIGQQSNNL